MATFTKTSQDAQTSRIPRRRGGMSSSTSRLVGRLLSYSLLLSGAVVMIFPLVWMALASFKPEWQILTTPPIWIPSQWEQVQGGDTAKEFPLWYTDVDGERMKVLEIGTRRYTSVVDVTQIPDLVSVPADQLSGATPETFGDVRLNARTWRAEDGPRQVVALARDGDNLVVAPVETLLDHAERRPLDEVNAGARVRATIDDYTFLGREAPDGEGVLIQIGPEWQSVIVVPVEAARDAFLVAEDAPVDPQFVTVGETELPLYALRDRPADERYVLLSVEAWQPIIELDQLETAHLTVAPDRLAGEPEIRAFGAAVKMPVDTLTHEDGTTQEVIILQEQTARSLVIPVEEASTLQLAPVSKRLGEPFVRNIDRVPVRYIDNYEEDGRQKSVALVGSRVTMALVAPQAIVSQAFDVQQKALDRVLHIRFRYENYIEAMSKNLGGANFVTFFKNSTIVVALNLVGHYFSVILVAYAFARLRAPGKNVLFLILLSTMMLPFPVLLIPTYEIFQTFGMLNTLWPLFVRAFFGNAFLIFLLRQFFMSIPRELEEAAIIDGANTLQVLWHVMLPLSKPALATIGIFTFWWHWNAFLEPFVYVNSVKNFTVSLGLAFFKGQYVYNFHWLMAAGMVAIIPVITIFFFAQRYFIEGIQLTGLKG